MLRNILLAIDDAASAINARRLAMELAASSGASITGLAIVDSPWIVGVEPVPLGGLAYKEASDAEQLRQARERMRAALREFERLACTSGTKYALVEREGAPEKVLQAECVAHDLIVASRDAFRHFPTDTPPSEATDALVRHSPRPLLLTPPDGAQLSRVIVALDDSVPASRALYLFCLLGLHVGREIRLVTVAQHRESAERTVSHAAALLAAHGAADVEETIVAGSARPSDVLASQAQAWGAGCIVMGAYGHRGLQALLLGSTTRALLETSAAALFLHP